MKLQTTEFRKPVHIPIGIREDAEDGLREPEVRFMQIPVGIRGHVDDGSSLQCRLELHGHAPSRTLSRAEGHAS